MKKILKNLANTLVIPVFSYIYYNLPSAKKGDSVRPSVKQILLLRAKEDSANYIHENVRTALIFETRQEIWNYTISHIQNSKKTYCLEFGVWKGRSINYFSSKLSDCHFIGFDSFEGLAEDWKGQSLTKGYFDLQGELPQVNQNVRLIKGFFDKTVALTIKSIDQQLTCKFIHIDCDTYESTQFVLEQITDIIKPGVLILFDDYLGYTGWHYGGYLAFKEFCENSGTQYIYKAFRESQALVEITGQVQV